MPGAVEGAALLVAGHGAIGPTPFDDSAIHTLGRIGETLLATGASWRIRRLSPGAGEAHVPDRATIKRQLDELAAAPLHAAVLVIHGVISDIDGPALVTSAEPSAYPEDATLPLAWIGERLRAMRAERLLVVLSGRGTSSSRAWLDAIATHKGEHVIAVASSSDGCPLVDALLAGLCGDALDRSTGTVTMKSVSEYLGMRVPDAVVQGSDLSSTLASSPPLVGLWDMHRSHRSKLRTPPERSATDAPDDLTGTVLPGRFRLDATIARGTFGTVYRAHQLAVERDVAVKVLHPDIDPTSDDGRLFVHEVRAVGRIDHPNVVRIHQADITHDGRLFYAMELLDGRDLQQLIADGVVPRERAVALTCQLLEALGAAHEAGLVHADIKPANAIVVPRDGSERVVLVDFGLARLRAPDRAAESAGGTPAYMAPEQLTLGRVDARSDLFSAAVVLVALLTGWRRPNRFTLRPPLDGIEDAELRRVLDKALAVDPGDRYQSARELAAALTGTALAQPVQTAMPRAPFRSFAPFTEHDRGRLHGRDAEIAALTEHVLYRRSLIYTAPSGTGKTSLLRAGLTPRLEALGMRVVHVDCRTTTTTAATHDIQQGGNKLVLVLDQLEAALADGELVEAALELAHGLANAEASVVLSVREDHLARLIARTQHLAPSIAIMRLAPLSLDGAREAIAAPLAEARLAIESELLDVLLADLRDAAAALAPELGWGDGDAVYPPHLQLAGSALYEALAPGEATLTLAHYRRLGGFAAIVGEHLERVLDVELADGRDAIARELLLALVTSHHERAIRGEAELVQMVAAQHPTGDAIEVLEVLRHRGLLVRVHADSEPSWELVHDSLVPRVEAWLDRRDLARRRAIELVRYHVRRSQPDAPSLLDRSELRELRAHDDAIAALDREWRAAGRQDAWTPQQLVARSRRALRRRTALFASIVLGSFAVATAAVARERILDARRIREQSLLDRDIGRFTLELATFDWDSAQLRDIALPARELPQLDWELHYPSPEDADAAAGTFEARHVARGEATREDTLRALVEARGGRAVLVVRGRGRAGAPCAASQLPVTLPGYAQRTSPPTLRIRIPTCAASRASMIEIPGGAFVYGGAGDPPSQLAATSAQPQLVERRMQLPAFAIDRTEVTNAGFAVFAEMATYTGIRAPVYPADPGLGQPSQRDRPVTGVTWHEARAFCRWLGKDLPSTFQWTRALRGGEQLVDRSPNPYPRRNLPWGPARDSIPAKVVGVGLPGVAPVGTYLQDRSIDGVLDLAGNAIEWTSSAAGIDGLVIVRGGGALETPSLGDLLDQIAIENPRPAAVRIYDLGFRCAQGLVAVGDAVTSNESR